MKDIRPFEGIITEQVSEKVGDQTRLSILSWKAELEIGKVTNSVVVRPNRVVPIQEAESHSHEITGIAAEQFHIYEYADQLILLHNNTLAPGGVKTEEVIPGTSKYLMVKSMFRRAPREGECMFTLASALSNDTAKRRGIAKQLVGQFRRITERNDVDTILSDFNTSAPTKAERQS